MVIVGALSLSAQAQAPAQPPSFSCAQEGAEVCSEAKFKLLNVDSEYFVKAYEGRREKFAEWMKGAALYIQSSTGIPASIIIAQAGIASNWGTNDAFRKSNNMFAHTCWNPGTTITGTVDIRGTKLSYKGVCGKDRETGQVGRYFKFNTKEDSILAYLHFLAISPSRFYRALQDDIRSGLKRQPIRATSFRSVASQVAAFSPETAYVNTLLQVIQQEKLPAVDNFNCWRCLMEGPKK